MTEADIEIILRPSRGNLLVDGQNASGELRWQIVLEPLLDLLPPLAFVQQQNSLFDFCERQYA
jgi:hypothetical protein